ncbi:NUDIX domain-containing protein [Priestia megaterium]|uniref:NUDIX domain-containing protein n=1 Tax=Priestia megaterium TaxID=1404 RepID=UPI000BEDADB9|nr:NUDIX domain-containing protein [Priestia megaterium]PED64034.1 hypothetical protein CON20_24025 [Priestia megaterium]
MNKMDEIIIAAPRSKVFENEELAFQGTLQDRETVEIIATNIADSYISIRRGDAEEQPKYKQPIPYAIIQRGNDIYLYERLSGGGETRLHNKLSLGVGGHMNPIDNAKDFNEVLEINLERELEEELVITDKNFTVTPIGLINDDSDPVGEVHIGVLCVIKVSEDSEVYVREVDQLAGWWISLEELKQKEVFDRLENWSKIAVDIL